MNDLYNSNFNSNIDSNADSNTHEIDTDDTVVFKSVAANDNTVYVPQPQPTIGADAPMAPEPPLPPQPPVAPQPQPTQYTAEAILARIDALVEQSNAIISAGLEAVANMPVSSDGSNRSRSDTIRYMVEKKLESNREVMELLRQMYNDLKGKQPGGNISDKDKLEFLRSIIHSTHNGDVQQRCLDMIVSMMGLSGGHTTVSENGGSAPDGDSIGETIRRQVTESLRGLGDSFKGFNQNWK